MILDRRGYAESAPGDGEDFEVDAVDIRDALDTGAHLVAHSYGGLGALLAAAARPEAVYSLTLIEPVAFSAAIHVPIVRECVGRLAVHWATHTSNPRDFLEGFLPVMGLPSKLPDPLPPTMERGTKSLMRGRLAFTAYDAYMLELARTRGLPLLTLDAKLSAVARRAGIELLEV